MTYLRDSDWEAVTGPSAADNAGGAATNSSSTSRTASAGVVSPSAVRHRAMISSTVRAPIDRTAYDCAGATRPFGPHRRRWLTNGCGTIGT